MKRPLILLVFFVSFVVTPLVSHADTAKMDGFLRILHREPAAGTVLLGKAVSTIDDTVMVDCLVKSTDVVATEAAIVEAGGVVGARLSTILTARIPLSALEFISDRPEVTALEAAKPLSSKMNAARAFTNVDDVQAGTGLDKSYDGKGVLVGVVDDGINWKHPDFSGRVVWLEQRSGSTLLVCDDIDIRDGTCNVTNGGGTFHGTHVTGIAAGNDATYKGVANQSSIGFVYNWAADAESSGTFSTAVLEGVDSLFFVADELDIAAVVNLSLGTSLGAHDDTSLFEQGLNELVDGQRGRIITNAAGNENVNPNWFDSQVPGWSANIGGIHAGIDVPAGGAKGWRYGIWNGSALASFTGQSIVDVWLNADLADSCVIDVKAYEFPLATVSDYLNIIPPMPGTTTTDAELSVGNVSFAADATGTATIADRIKVDVNTYRSEATNGKPHAIVIVEKTGSAQAADVSRYAYDVIIRATGAVDCTGDMWLYPDQTAIHDFITGIDTLAPMGDGANGAGYDYADGDSFKTTTIPGTASGVITVGSYSGRNTWVDIDGNTQDQNVFNSPGGGSGTQAGQVSLFSSLGPTADGRNKPDVVAPGEPIISTLASGVSAPPARLGDSTHWKIEGTSMSSPHVAGIVALMLQKNNCLTPVAVKALLQTSAKVSTLTSYTPDAKDTYGSGIVDALIIMQEIAANTSCYSGNGGGGGGSGCGTLAPAAPTTAAGALVLMLAPLAAVIWRRRKR